MKHTIKIFATAIVSIGSLFCTSLTAQAGVITQTFSYAMVSTDWDYVSNIAKINLAPGGVLNNVAITETVDWNAYISGSNVDTTASVTVTKSRAELTVYDSLTGFYSPIIDQYIGYTNYPGLTLTHNTSYVFGNYYSTNSFAYDYTAPGDVAAYLGAGVDPLEVYTTTYNDVGSTHGAFYEQTQNTQASLDIQVIYNYSGIIIPAAVPEPSAGILLGVGGLICWGWRRKTTRKA